MTKSLTLSDVLGLGFMTFAFYLGAGKYHLPALARFLAGEHLSLAMLGFLVTAVGLPDHHHRRRQGGQRLGPAYDQAAAGWRGPPPWPSPSTSSSARPSPLPVTGLVALRGWASKPFIIDMGQAGLIAYTVVFFGISILVSRESGQADGRHR